MHAKSDKSEGTHDRNDILTDKKADFPLGTRVDIIEENRK